jgi:hypothetical protein
VAALEVLQVGLAEQRLQQEVQAGALREGLMEIHGQRAALAWLVEQWENGEKPHVAGAEPAPASSRSDSQLGSFQLHLDTILGTVMERVEQRLDRELASTQDVVSEAVEAHVQHTGELGEDHAVWLTAEVRRLSAVVDAAPWTRSQEALKQDLDVLQEGVQTVLRHSENVNREQETLKQELASCIHSSREALMACSACSFPSLARKLEALEATEEQHWTEVTMALESLTQSVAELAVPPQGQWDAQQPKVAASNQQHRGQHVEAATPDAGACGTETEAQRKNQRGSTPVKPGDALILEKVNSNTPARAVVPLAVISSSPARSCRDWQGASPVEVGLEGLTEKFVWNANSKEGCASLPVTPQHGGG